MEWTPIVDCAYDADISVGDLSGDVYPITIQLKDFAGNDLTVPAAVHAYVASDAAGLDPVDCTTDLHTTDSGDGAVLILLQYYHYLLISEADGDIAVDFEDDGTDDRYLVLVMPNGKLVVSGVLTY